MHNAKLNETSKLKGNIVCSPKPKIITFIQTYTAIPTTTITAMSTPCPVPGCLKTYGGEFPQYSINRHLKTCRELNHIEYQKNLEGMRIEPSQDKQGVRHDINKRYKERYPTRTLACGRLGQIFKRITQQDKHLICPSRPVTPEVPEANPYYILEESHQRYMGRGLQAKHKVAEAREVLSQCQSQDRHEHSWDMRNLHTIILT